MYVKASEMCNNTSVLPEFSGFTSFMADPLIVHLAFENLPYLRAKHPLYSIYQT